jgi:tetratricopeptide (TPR) repeat protein
VLVTILLGHDRHDEALNEARAMGRLGWRAEGGFYEGMALFGQDRPYEAAQAIANGLAASPDTIGAYLSGFQNWTTPMVLLAGAGGRWAASLQLNAALFASVPFDSGPGPGSVRMSASDMARLSEWYLAGEVGQPHTRPGEARDAAGEWRAVIERLARGRPADRRRIAQSLGTGLVTLYLATRDTTLLTELLARADTLQSSTWRVADAQLALERGDTARARMRVERHYHTPASFEFSGEQGMVRALAWADLLTRLGDRRAALAAYARMDSLDARHQHPGFVVRAWAERGALHQSLGDTADAVRQYERFIAAWRDADPELQPMVERARAAVAALSGAVSREPGERR